MEEYTIFTVTDSQGCRVELAVVDEFSFENKDYVAAARVEGDAISEEGLFIYRVKSEGEEYIFEKITNAVDYQRVARAYLELED